MRLPNDIEELAAQTIAAFRRKELKIATAESCTGGLIAAALTSIAGSSAVFERGFVTYSLDSKSDLLGVLPETLHRSTAVSAQVADEMAAGALEYSLADCALSVTGLAGPDGGTPQKPVGLVYFGLAARDGTHFHVESFFHGDRATIRHLAVMEGLNLLRAFAEG